MTLETGDILQIAMPGGGGYYGHPFDREPERVLRDVLAGFVSSESALEDYGVVLDVESEAIDLAATRDRRAAHRWPTKLFHRRRYFDAEEWWDSADALRSSRPSRV